MYSAGSLFRVPVDIVKASPLQLRAFESNIWKALEFVSFMTDSTNVMSCESVSVNGLKYSKSIFIIISRDEDGLEQLGEVQVILVNNETDVYFATSILQ
jgi:hypothetical protein